MSVLVLIIGPFVLLSIMLWRASKRDRAREAADEETWKTLTALSDRADAASTIKDIGDLIADIGALAAKPEPRSKAHTVKLISLTAYLCGKMNGMAIGMAAAKLAAIQP